MNTGKTIGDWGERLARAYLESKGFDHVASKYQTRYGEIDLIMRDGEYVIFVEVKLRRDREHGEAREFVTLAKRKRVRNTAQIWLIANETDLQPRFDVIEIYAPDGANTASPEIIHLEDAF